MKTLVAAAREPYRAGNHQGDRQDAHAAPALLRDRDVDGQPDHRRLDVEVQHRLRRLERVPLLSAARAARRRRGGHHERVSVEHAAGRIGDQGRRRDRAADRRLAGKRVGERVREGRDQALRRMVRPLQGAVREVHDRQPDGPARAGGDGPGPAARRHHEVHRCSAANAKAIRTTRSVASSAWPSPAVRRHRAPGRDRVSRRTLPRGARRSKAAPLPPMHPRTCCRRSRERATGFGKHIGPDLTWSARGASAPLSNSARHESGPGRIEPGSAGPQSRRNGRRSLRRMFAGSRNGNAEAPRHRYRIRERKGWRRFDGHGHELAGVGTKNSSLPSRDQSGRPPCAI